MYMYIVCSFEFRQYLRYFFWKIINYNQYVMFVIPVMLN